MSARLLPLLHPSRVLVGAQEPDKAAVLDRALRLAATSDTVRDADVLRQDVLAREETMSTGVGQGLAFPHARTDAVGATVVSLLTLAEPVEFGSLDGAPVRIVLLLAGPSDERTAHVRLLGRASRLFADDATRNAVQTATSVDAVIDTLQAAEQALDARS